MLAINRSARLLDGAEIFSDGRVKFHEHWSGRSPAAPRMQKVA